MPFYSSVCSLSLVLLAACSAVAGPPTALPSISPTRTSIVLPASLSESTPLPVLSTLVNNSTLGNSAPAVLPTHMVETAPALPQTTAFLADTPSASIPSVQIPLPISASERQPWQFFSSAMRSRDSIFYRLRYPRDWYAYTDAQGQAVLQNFPGQDVPPGSLENGMVKLEISASFSPVTGGFPPPNTRPLVFGLPGTRRVLVDSVSGITIWNVRLFGISNDSATFNLTGTLRGSVEEINAGVKTLDEILSKLELYALPTPFPTPVPPDDLSVDTWDALVSSLESETGTFKISFRFPTGWWAYPDQKNRIEMTNYFRDDPNGRFLFAPEEMNLVIETTSCAFPSGCPKELPVLAAGLPGTREIYKNGEGGTLWVIQLYKDQTHFTLTGGIAGSEEEVRLGIGVFERLLGTLTIR